ncbi:MAG: glycosyltransferase family 4 protein [Odoribacter splanchnicus]
MKIAYIVPSLANKGPVLVVKDLVEQMIKNGQQCSVFYFDDIREVEFNCPVCRIKFGNKIHFEQFDIVHSHGIRPDGYVFLHKPYKTKTRFVTTLHNYVLRDFSSQYNRFIAYVFGNLWMLLLRRHNKIVTLSQDAMRYYGKWFSDIHLTNAYNTRNISRKETLTEDEKKEITIFKGEDILIGVNALLTTIKGVDLLIRALPQLPGYKLFIAGDGKIKEKLIRMAQQCGVEEQVLFAGYRRNAYRYLGFYDIYAMPSRSEGFPLAMLEAANIGIPVVCSDIAIFREIFTPEEVAFFKLEDVSSLANAIRSATGNLAMAQRMHQKYQECYSPERFYQRYISIYQSLL